MDAFLLLDFNETCIFWQIFGKSSVSGFMKFRLRGSEFFFCAEGRTDGRTDRPDEADSRFLQICDLALQRKQLQ